MFAMTFLLSGRQRSVSSIASSSARGATERASVDTSKFLGKFCDAAGERLQRMNEPQSSRGGGEPRSSGRPGIRGVRVHQCSSHDSVEREGGCQMDREVDQVVAENARSTESVIDGEGEIDDGS